MTFFLHRNNFKIISSYYASRKNISNIHARFDCTHHDTWNAITLKWIGIDITIGMRYCSFLISCKIHNMSPSSRISPKTFAFAFFYFIVLKVCFFIDGIFFKLCFVQLIPNCQTKMITEKKL